MNAVPDPQSLREVVRKNLTVDAVNVTPGGIVAIVKAHLGDDVDRQTLQVWYHAMSEELAGAVFGTTVSWPDEQSQDERDACRARLPADSAQRLGASPDTTCARPDGHMTHGDGNGVLWADREHGAQDERDARIAQLERELRDLRGTELNPSPLMLDAEAYGYLRDEIAATMTDDAWDLDGSESWILVQYVKWLAAGQPRHENGWPAWREGGYPAAEGGTAQSERGGEVG